MATLTESVKRELLDAAKDPARIQAVLTRHSRSKGPLYHALAEATSQLSARLTALQGEAGETEDRLRATGEEIQRRERRLQELDSLVDRAESRLAEVQPLLNQADELARLGFGMDHLRRLAGLLAEVAASQGAPPEEGVAQFFETVSRYEKVVSLDLETKRAQVKAANAKAEADRWQAEARRVEARSKLRRETIEIAERLLAAGVREADFPAWAKVLAKAGVTPGGLAEALESYASLEELKKAWQTRVARLQSQSQELGSRLAALTAERQGLHAAIQEVSAEAVKRLRQVAGAAMQAGEDGRAQLDALLQRHASLQQEAAELDQWIRLARAFRDHHKDQWVGLPASVIQHLLAGLFSWAGIEGRDGEVVPPPDVCQRNRVSSWNKVHLSDLLLWAYTGVETLDQIAQQKALASGR